MQSRNLLLVFLALAAVVWAWTSHSSQRPEAADSSHAFALPDFRESINQVTKLEMEKDGQRLVALRLEGEWVAPEMFDYPLKDDQVRPFLLQLAALDHPEAKTTNPANHGKLELADPGMEGGGTSLRLWNEAGDALLDLVLGKTRWQPKPGIYFRHVGEDQAWSAEGRLQLQTDAKLWMDREVARMPAADFQSMHLAGTEEFHIRRETATDPWILEEELPTGRTLREGNPFAGLAGALGFVNFDGVRPLSEEIFSTPPSRTLVWTTFDGGSVTANLWQEEEIAWVRLTAEGTLTEETNPLWQDWGWQLPSFKAGVFQQSWEDWLQALPEEEEANSED